MGAMTTKYWAAFPSRGKRGNMNSALNLAPAKRKTNSSQCIPAVDDGTDVRQIHSEVLVDLGYPVHTTGDDEASRKELLAVKDDSDSNTPKLPAVDPVKRLMSARQIFTLHPTTIMKNLKTPSLTTLQLTFAVQLTPSTFAQSAGNSGESAYARITRSKQALMFNPNQVGNFPASFVLLRMSW